MEKRKEMVDIHSHLLPQIDDGAKSMDETIAMIEFAISQGFTGTIVTPHYQCGQEQNVKRITDALEKVQLELKERDLDYSLWSGNECLYTKGIVRDLKENKAFTLAQSRYVLVEFEITESFNIIYHGLREFLENGYAPVLAHAERYECLGRKLDKAIELSELGIYFQLNYSCLFGRLFNREIIIAKKLVENEMVHFLATDSHGIHHRPPAIDEGLKVIARKASKEYLNNILFSNPLKLIQNRFI